MDLRDVVTIDGGDVRVTRDGYLAASPRVARTGIQIYAGRELGRPELDKVRVYRPADEVFSTDSLTSFAFRPITNDHPAVPVDSKNWRDHSVGVSDGTVARDGEFVRVPMLVMDQGAIDAWRGGKAQLSVGYSADLKWGDGVTPDGQQYDATQTNIRANHIAIVGAARGGPKLRIGDGEDDDTSNGSNRMNDKVTPTKIADVGGVQIEMSDIAHQVVAREIARLTKDIETRDMTAEEMKEKIAEMQAMLKKMEEGKAADKATTDAKIATLEQQLKDAELTPAKLDSAVKDRQSVVGKARGVLGDKLVHDGKTAAEIMRQVVDSKLGETAKDWKDDAIKTSFDTLTAGVKSVDTLAGDLSRGGNVDDASKGKQYKKYDTDISNRWKGKAA